MSALGFHYLWDVYQCKYSNLEKVAPVKQLMEAILDRTKLTIISSNFNQFSPHGVTGIYLLEESHLSIHTWPENNYAAIDLFSCIALDQETIHDIQAIIKSSVGAESKCEFKKVERGLVKSVEFSQ
jgi:S-adenosylmethionine decarboxylase